MSVHEIKYRALLHLRTLFETFVDVVNIVKKNNAISFMQCALQDPNPYKPKCKIKAAQRYYNPHVVR
jgi:hypothetical protein